MRTEHRVIALGVGLACMLTHRPVIAAGPGSAEPSADEDDPEPEVTDPQVTVVDPSGFEVDPANYRMVLAGDVVVGFGGAAFILMGAGLAVWSDANRRHDGLSALEPRDDEAVARQARRRDLGANLAIAGGVSAGALLAAGITLIVVGRAKERRRRDALLRAAGLAPSFGADHLGLTWSLRF